MSKASKDVGRPLAVKPSLDAIAESQRAEWRVEHYSRHFEIAADQVVGLSKWLVASLFAANSGGLLTLLNQADKIGLPLWSGGSFILGLVLALLSATANQEFYNRMSDPLIDMIEYWQEVRITGEPNKENQDKLEARMNAISRCTWIGPTLGWFSGISFIAGTVFISVGLI